MSGIRSRWLAERKKDYHYRKAKKEGYKSRAAYKLKEINEKYHIIKKGDRVIDLGAAPGGWSQVAKEIVGDKGFVLGVDIEYITPIENVEFIRGDITEKTIMEEVQSVIGSANVIISDISPNISGNSSLDHTRSVFLCEKALEYAMRFLVPNGNFITKIFQGEMFNDYLNKLKQQFTYIHIYKPKSSKKNSAEIYIICKGFKKI